MLAKGEPKLKLCDERGFTLLEALLAFMLILLCMFLITSLLFVYNHRSEMKEDIGTLYSLKQAIMEMESFEEKEHHFSNFYGTFQVTIRNEEVCIKKQSEQKKENTKCLKRIQK